MKGMKGKFLKKLKSVKQISYHPDRILQVSSFDGFVDKFPLKSTLVDNFPFKPYNKSQCSPQSKLKSRRKPEVIDVEELIKDLEEEDEEINPHCDFDDKENTYPSIVSNDPVSEMKKSGSCCKELEKQSEIIFDVEEKGNNLELGNLSSCCIDSKKQSDLEVDVESFRRPDMYSGSLFDPKLLAAFEEAVKHHVRTMEAAELETTSKKHNNPFFQPEDQTDPLLEFDEQSNPLAEFEEKCPPGGSDSVIFYTTSLRGIRKTFEDCQSIRFLLESFGLIYYERDVSIHSEFRDGMWRIMREKCLPPKLFIRGRYIGGAEKVLTLHEQGRLRPLFRDIPINFSEGPCNVCSGLRFILCYNCNGSRKVFEHDNDQEGNRGGSWTKCSKCNENGLVVCPLC